MIVTVDLRILIIWSIHYCGWISATPPDFCFEPFDRSDCNFPPREVFYFYKPGMRCETATWRGCPTRNMFENEFLCSHFCIGKFLDTKDDDDEDDMGLESEEEDICNSPLVTQDCGVAPVTVYTYSENVCVNDTWRGCQTLNKFEDMASCEDACEVLAEEHYEKKLEKLPIEEVHNIIEILDVVIAPPSNFEKLKLGEPMSNDENTAEEEEEEEPSASDAPIQLKGMASFHDSSGDPEEVVLP